MHVVIMSYAMHVVYAPLLSHELSSFMLLLWFWKLSLSTALCAFFLLLDGRNKVISSYKRYQVICNQLLFVFEFRRYSSEFLPVAWNPIMYALVRSIKEEINKFNRVPISTWHAIGCYQGDQDHPPWPRSPLRGRWSVAGAGTPAL